MDVTIKVTYEIIQKFLNKNMFYGSYARWIYAYLSINKVALKVKEYKKNLLEQEPGSGIGLAWKKKHK